MGGFHQVEAILLGLGQGFLMRKHNPLGELLQMHLSDQAHDAPPATGHTADVAHALQVELDFIHVESGFVVLPENALLQPAAQRLPRGGIRVGPIPGQLQPDDVVRIAGQIRQPLGLGNDVVGRAGKLADVPARSVNRRARKGRMSAILSLPP